MSTEKINPLLFVYNADSGLFNTMTDIAHKMLSPSTYACSLCAITHGVFAEKQEWRAFIEELGVPVEFLHRDEFERQYSAPLDAYPAILQNQNGNMNVLLAAADINRCHRIDELRQLVESIVNHP